MYFCINNDLLRIMASITRLALPPMVNSWQLQNTLKQVEEHHKYMIKDGKIIQNQPNFYFEHQL